MTIRPLLATVALIALVGCGGGTPTGPDGESNDASSAPGPAKPTEDGGPLMDLPECSAAPESIPADVDGLVLPDGAAVTAVEDVGELVSVRAYVDQTPIQVRQFYAKEPGLELFELEDEVYEAEVLFGEADHRTFVRAQAQCQQGSLLTVFVGPADADSLPSVTGG